MGFISTVGGFNRRLNHLGPAHFRPSPVIKELRAIFWDLKGSHAVAILPEDRGRSPAAIRLFARWTWFPAPLSLCHRSIPAFPNDLCPSWRIRLSSRMISCLSMQPDADAVIGVIQPPVIVAQEADQKCAAQKRFHTACPRGPVTPAGSRKNVVGFRAVHRNPRRVQLPGQPPALPRNGKAALWTAHISGLARAASPAAWAAGNAQAGAPAGTAPSVPPSAQRP